MVKVSAEIVNGKCPTCDEFTMLVGLTNEMYRCMNCGSDLHYFSFLKFGISTAPRDKPKKRPGRHKKSRNKHEKRQQKKQKKG